MASNLICMGFGTITDNAAPAYITPNGVKAVISEIIVYNTNQRQVSGVNLSIGEEGRLIPLLGSLELLPQETRFITLATVLNPGDRLFLKAESLTPGLNFTETVTYRISGAEVSDV